MVAPSQQFGLHKQFSATPAGHQPEQEMLLSSKQLLALILRDQGIDLRQFAQDELGLSPGYFQTILDYAKNTPNYNGGKGFNWKRATRISECFTTKPYSEPAFWAMDGYHTIPCTDPIPKLNLQALTAFRDMALTDPSNTAPDANDTPIPRIQMPLKIRAPLYETNASRQVVLKYN